MNSSIQDVAKAAGVSISTVSRSFTRPDLVSARTRAKVLAIAEELNFSLSRSAAALKSGRSLRVAVLMSGRIRLWFNSSVLEGLNEVMHAEGYDISIFRIAGEEERRGFFEMLPVRRNVDAVIVVSFDITDHEVEQLNSAGVPIIGINTADAVQHGFHAAIGIDDEQGSTLAARHLLALGHRSIAYVRAARDVSLNFSLCRRRDVFLDTCRKAGVDAREVVCRIDADGRYRIDGLMSDVMSMDAMPTAVACQEDAIAMPLLFQLARSGFAVPGDVSIVGYDDGFYTEDIGLTTIRQDPAALARDAARMALDLIEGRTPDEPFRTVPAELVVRSSTARPRRA